MGEVAFAFRARRYSVEALRAHPPAMPLSDANRILALTRSTAYRLIAEGNYPCELIRVGGVYRVLTSELLRLLEIDDRHLVAAFEALPPALPLHAANNLLSLGRTVGYRLARQGNYPCEVLRLGGDYRIRKNDLRCLVKVPEATAQRAA
ncbi:hypothetical protein [Streptacidiphilus sp. MAP5-52]|uniref:hypothetical protein n=1 Tax=Streptacidiphilus sp. MAP5-52 TaxID=3156267 RepID=UPI003513CD73